LVVVLERQKLLRRQRVAMLKRKLLERQLLLRQRKIAMLERRLSQGQHREVTSMRQLEM
jgi:hypothetical protein